MCWRCSVLVSRETLERLVDGILEGDIRSLLRITGDLDNAGKDLQRLLVEIISYFAICWCVCMWIPLPRIWICQPNRWVFWLRRSKKSNTGRLLRVVTMLSEAEDRMRYALSRRVLLETVLIRCARAATVVTLEEILEKIQALREAGGGGAAGPARAVQQEAEFRSRATTVWPSDGETIEARVQESRVALPGADAEGPGDTDLHTLAKVKQCWPEVVKRVGKIAVGSAGVLDDLVPLQVEGNYIVIGYPLEFRERMGVLKQPRLQSGLHQILRRFLEKDVIVRWQPFDGPAPVIEIPAEIVEQVSGKDTAARSASKGARNASRATWYQDPHVQAVLEAFNGEITDVHDSH
jgi:DNA polymerase III subunit gamma/tau